MLLHAAIQRRQPDAPFSPTPAPTPVDRPAWTPFDLSSRSLASAARFAAFASLQTLALLPVSCVRARGRFLLVKDVLIFGPIVILRSAPPERPSCLSLDLA